MKERASMPKQVGIPESLRKALAGARDERERINAIKAAEALAAGVKKSLKKVKHK
jgi:hypothetical protein